jgi:thiamine biosynthesis protein ThiS
MKNLLINGESCQTVATGLAELFNELSLPPPLLLVEYNGVALSRSEWDSVSLADGDRLELMKVAAGG